MLDGATAGLEMAEIAASADPLPRRAEQLLAVLRRYIPFDSGWLALADPQHPRYTTLAGADLADGTRAFFESPQQAHDIEAVGLHGPAPPLDPSDLPYPVEELPGWAECLIPAGYRGGLSLSLVAAGGRHVGFLGLPCASREPPSTEARRLLAEVSALLGRAVDPARTLAATTRLVHDAHAGVVLHADGGLAPLPGLVEHPLLVAGSRALAAARAVLAAGRVHQSFLWPLGGRHAPDGHARLTVLAPPGDLPIHLTGLVLRLPARRPAGSDGAGAGGAGPAGRGMLELGDLPRPGHHPAHRRRAPGAHPGQADGLQPDACRGARGAGRPVRPPGVSP